MHHKSFSLRRIFLMAKVDLTLQASKVFLYACVLFAIGVLANLSGNTQTFSSSPGFHFFLIVIGAFLASRSLNVIHRADLGIAFYSLPCTILEKFIERLLLTSVGFFIAWLFLYSIMRYLMGMFHGYGFSDNYFYLFNPTIWGMLIKFMMIHAVFFTGSAYFKNNAFMKTLLVIVSVSILAALVTIPFSHYHYNQISFIGLYDSVSFINYFYSILIIAVCWLATYFRLRESEIN